MLNSQWRVGVFHKALIGDVEFTIDLAKSWFRKWLVPRIGAAVIKEKDAQLLMEIEY